MPDLRANKISSLEASAASEPNADIISCLNIRHCLPISIVEEQAEAMFRKFFFPKTDSLCKRVVTLLVLLCFFVSQEYSAFGTQAQTGTSRSAPEERLDPEISGKQAEAINKYYENFKERLLSITQKKVLDVPDLKDYLIDLSVHLKSCADTESPHTLVISSVQSSGSYDYYVKISELQVIQMAIIDYLYLLNQRSSNYSEELAGLYDRMLTREARRLKSFYIETPPFGAGLQLEEIKKTSPGDFRDAKALLKLSRYASGKPAKVQRYFNMVHNVDNERKSPHFITDVLENNNKDGFLVQQLFEDLHYAAFENTFRIYASNLLLYDPAVKLSDLKSEISRMASRVCTQKNDEHGISADCSIRMQRVGMEQAENLKAKGALSRKSTFEDIRKVINNQFVPQINSARKEFVGSVTVEGVVIMDKDHQYSTLEESRRLQQKGRAIVEIRMGTDEATQNAISKYWGTVNYLVTTIPEARFLLSSDEMRDRFLRDISIQGRVEGEPGESAQDLLNRATKGTMIRYFNKIQKITSLEAKAIYEGSQEKMEEYFLELKKEFSSFVNYSLSPYEENKLSHYYEGAVKLIQESPATSQKVLLDNPMYYGLLPSLDDTIWALEKELERKQEREKWLLTAGLILGGVLLCTGVLSWLGVSAFGFSATTILTLKGITLAGSLIFAGLMAYETYGAWEKYSKIKEDLSREIASSFGKEYVDVEFIKSIDEAEASALFNLVLSGAFTLASFLVVPELFAFVRAIGSGSKVAIEAYAFFGSNIKNISPLLAEELNVLKGTARADVYFERLVAYCQMAGVSEKELAVLSRMNLADDIFGFLSKPLSKEGMQDFKVCLKTGSSLAPKSSVGAATVQAVTTGTEISSTSIRSRQFYLHASDDPVKMDAINSFFDDVMKKIKPGTKSKAQMEADFKKVMDAFDDAHLTYNKPGGAVSYPKKRALVNAQQELEKFLGKYGVKNARPESMKWIRYLTDSKIKVLGDPPVETLEMFVSLGTKDKEILPMLEGDQWALLDDMIKEQRIATAQEISKLEKSLTDTGLYHLLDIDDVTAVNRLNKISEAKINSLEVRSLADVMMKIEPKNEADILADMKILDEVFGGNTEVLNLISKEMTDSQSWNRIFVSGTGNTLRLSKETKAVLSELPFQDIAGLTRNADKLASIEYLMIARNVTVSQERLMILFRYEAGDLRMLQESVSGSFVATDQVDFPARMPGLFPRKNTQFTAAEIKTLYPERTIPGISTRVLGPTEKINSQIDQLAVSDRSILADKQKFNSWVQNGGEPRELSSGKSTLFGLTVTSSSSGTSWQIGHFYIGAEARIFYALERNSGDVILLSGCIKPRSLTTIKGATHLRDWYSSFLEQNENVLINNLP